MVTFREGMVVSQELMVISSEGIFVSREGIIVSEEAIVPFWKRVVLVSGDVVLFRNREAVLGRSDAMHTAKVCLLPVVVSIAACGAAPTAAPVQPTAAASVPSRSRIQQIASEELDSAVRAWGGTRGVVVVVDPHTGAVLAAEGREHGKSDATLASERAWVTGSTLKPITIAAALDAGTITLDQRFSCGERHYGAKLLHDAHEGPCAPLDARGVVAQSSNVGVSYVFDTLGSAKLTAWLRALHVGDAPGVLPPIDDDNTVRAASFAGGELAEATPLQMARAYAAIFNDGVYMAPSAAGGAVATRVMKPETARTVVSMLENAVAGDGTGKRARIAGARVAGKTGTADVEGEKDEYYVSFVGSVLDREPAFVSLFGLVGPDDKVSGPETAAPAWQKLASRILAER